MSDERATDTDLTDPYVPVDSDGQPLQWLDGNRAKIPGLIHEVQQHYTRNGLFEALLEHGAVITSGGRIAIPSKTTIPFIQGDIQDPEAYTLKNRIPSASERVALYEDYCTAHSISAYDFSTMDPVDTKTYSVSTLLVKQELNRLLRSLKNVFGHSHQSERLLLEAKGDGFAFLDALETEAALAEPSDVAIITSNFDSIKFEGIQGEVTLDKLQSFVRKYKRARQDLDPARRPSDGSEIEMINLIAFKDPALRTVYAIKRAASKPTNLESAVSIITGILTENVRAEELDQASSRALSIDRAPAHPPRPPALDANVQALIAAITEKIGKPDPNKPLGESKRKKKERERKEKIAERLKLKEGEKVEIPRDANGHPTKWVKGMRPCTCGGEHLFKDCDKDKPKPSGDANISQGIPAIENLTPEQLGAFVEAYMNREQPSNGAGMMVCGAAEDDGEADGAVNQ